MVDRTFEDYYGIVNVMDYGCAADGTTDDTTAIQNAINAANMGTTGVPHADYSSKALYFPSGKYRTTRPLYFFNVTGGHVYGTGASEIYFQPAALQDVGNAVVAVIGFGTQTGNFTAGQVVTGGTSGATGTLASQADAGATGTLTLHGTVAGVFEVGEIITDPLGGSATVTSVGQYFCAMVFDGVGYSKFENLNIICANNTGFQTSTNTIGTYLYQTGNLGGVTNRGYTGGISFYNCQWRGWYVGVLGGADAGNVDLVQFYNCTFVANRLAGLRTVGANALDWGFFGGGASSNGTETTYDPVVGPTSGNGGAAFSCITGSMPVILNPAMSYNYIDVYNSSAAGMSVIGPRTESEGGQPMQIGIVTAGSPIHVSGASYTAQTEDCLWLDTTFGGSIVATGCMFNTVNGAGDGVIARLGNNGRIILDGIEWGEHTDMCTFFGASNARLTLRGISPSFFPATAFDDFTGRVVAWDLGEMEVGDLPTAAPKFQGLRAVVTDANATTLATTVAAGGANIVEVTCAASAWKITAVLN
jgi:hypothetical protein